MSDLGESLAVVHDAVQETYQSFHIDAALVNGEVVSVPVVYQLNEIGFRPFKAGKASDDELQNEYDRVVEEAETTGVNLGIENTESVRKLMLQLGLGIDCSNFAYRALSHVHDRLGIGPYTDRLYRSTDEVLKLHKGGRWPVRDASGNSRKLTPAEFNELTDDDEVAISVICRLFGKDPEHMAGAVHLGSERATRPVSPEVMRAGDFVLFHSAASGVVSHLGVVNEATTRGNTEIDFYHAWHTRDFDGGLRNDSLIIGGDGLVKWSHRGLSDPTRYRGISFRRPEGLAIHYASLGLLQ